LWLDEEVAVLLQELGQQGLLGLTVPRGELQLWCRGGAPKALPPDMATLAREGHREGVEVPQDWAEGPQEIHVKDEVEASQVDASARDGEVLIADVEEHMLCQPMAAQVVAVGHGHAEIIAARWLESKTTHGGDGKEIMHGARVQQCHQALTVNHHQQEHRALMAYAGQRMERDHERLGGSGGGCGLGWHREGGNSLDTSGGVSVSVSSTVFK
jgi:hypothetical protein